MPISALITPTPLLRRLRFGLLALAVAAGLLAASIQAPAGHAAPPAGSTHATVPHVSLADSFNNVGISDDTNPSAGNFDGAGYSYSAEMLKEGGGLIPGGTFAHDGISFTWPNVAPGSPDNVCADGQTIAVPGVQFDSTLAFIGASSAGSGSGTGTVIYADGQSSTFTLTLDDFWFAPGGNETAATVPTANSPSGSVGHNLYVYYQAVPIDPEQTVAAVVLPTISSSPAGHATTMHIFAIGIGTATTA